MFAIALAIYFLLILALSVVDLLVSNMNADELRDMGVWKKSKHMSTTPDPSAHDLAKVEAEGGHRRIC
jgi:hypothetical protein